MRAYFDRRGHYRGFSVSGWTALAFYLVVGLIVFAVVVLPFMWPLVVFHGVLAIVLTGTWNALLLLVALAVRRALRR